MNTKDLEFLYSARNEDLRILVDYLTKDKNGNYRLTEGLTSKRSYQAYYPARIDLMVDDVIDELERFGGNTIANFFRGGGVDYRTIVTGVAKKLKVNFNKKSDVAIIEWNILMKIFTDSLDKMSEEELMKLAKEMGVPIGRYTRFSKQIVINVLQIAIKKSGFAAYKIAVIVANAIAKALLGRGLSFAANATLTRFVSIFAGPIGWVLMALWTAIDIAGPAYRVTIPCVVQIAYMRILSNTKFDEEGLHVQ